MEFLDLDNKNYVYHIETNTLLNKKLVPIFLNHVEDRRADFRSEVEIDRETLKENVKNLKQIIFETTQRCNLKCKYCIYGDEYYSHTRSETAVDIELGTAKNTIDYIKSLVSGRSKKEITIGFYGGEPLLNFNFIKDTLQYSQKSFPGWKLRYTVTTNGTIYSPEIVDFLVKHDFMVLVSLDGPKESNDSKRIFKNGTGTYDAIIENLQRIKSLDANFYKENIHFSIVHSRDLCLEKTYRFFNDDPLVNQNIVNFGTVNRNNSTYYEKYPFDPADLRKKHKLIFESILCKRNDNTPLSPFETEYITINELVNNNLKLRQSSVWSGTCLFDSRLFVDAYGKFHVCERVNDKFSIGSADDGFRFDRMLEMFNSYVRSLKAHCTTCEVRFLCLRCYANFAQDGTFEISEQFCANQKRTIPKILSEIIRTNEMEASK